jgi:3-isopropylmalate/(R)-2-methylmalate dehydratase small subunit
MPRVWRLGDNINTDQIIPGRYNVTTDRAHLAQHCLCEHRPDFPVGVKAGDIIVANRNFGCGSSREHAAVALKATGLAAVVAVSFARIFYRNAINIGLPVLIAPDAVAFEEDEQIEIDTVSGIIQALDREWTVKAQPLPDFVQRIVEAGGIIPLVRQQGKLTVAGK